jgi:hypothetical protein
VIPTVGGDGDRFVARLELGNVWRDWMTECAREIVSPEPAQWRVRDQGQLRAAGLVAFHLHALQPFVEEGGRLFAQNSRGRVEIVAPWAVRRLLKVNLIDSGYRPVHHLRLVSKPLTTFDLCTEFVRV